MTESETIRKSTTVKLKKFRNRNTTAELIKNNPDISREDIDRFRKMRKIKQTSIRKFCEAHPEVDREYLVSAMPKDSIESLEKYNPLRYCKEHDLLEKNRPKRQHKVEKIRCSNCGHEN